MADEIAPAVAAAPAAAPAAPSPSVAPPSGPAPGATLPVAAEAVPAASSEPSVESPVANDSILSAAKPEEAPVPAAEAPAAEAPAETADAKPAEAAEAEKAAEPPKPHVYEIKLPDGVKLDDSKLGAFTGILGETEAKIAADPAKAHEAMQEFGQKAMDLYVSEMQAANERSARLQKEMWERTQEDWQSAFRNDPQLGKNRQETTLARMGGLMDLYGSSAGPERLAALRDIFTMTGAGNHIEVLRFVNWAAGRLTETARVVTPMMPRTPVQAGSRATRMYRNSIPNQGAA